MVRSPAAQKSRMQFKSASPRSSIYRFSPIGRDREDSAYMQQNKIRRERDVLHASQLQTPVKERELLNRNISSLK